MKKFFTCSNYGACQRPVEEEARPTAPALPERSANAVSKRIGFRVCKVDGPWRKALEVRLCDVVQIDGRALVKPLASAWNIESIEKKAYSSY